MTSLQYFSNVAIIIITLPNILVDVVSSYYRFRVYIYIVYTNYSSSDSTSHAIAPDDFTRSHNLLISYLEVIIADITAG